VQYDDGEVDAKETVGNVTSMVDVPRAGVRQEWHFFALSLKQFLTEYKADEQVKSKIFFHYYFHTVQQAIRITNPPHHKSPTTNHHVRKGIRRRRMLWSWQVSLYQLGQKINH
jgi:hypothetical protein